MYVRSNFHHKQAITDALKTTCMNEKSAEVIPMRDSECVLIKIMIINSVHHKSIVTTITNVQITFIV